MTSFSINILGESVHSLSESMNTSSNMDVSFGDTKNADTMHIGANQTSSLLEGAIFIQKNGYQQNEATSNSFQPPTELLSYAFDDIMSVIDYPELFFPHLIQVYKKFYGINLHLIVYLNQAYKIFNENERIHYQQNHAFIWCSDDFTTFSPLYFKKHDGRMATIFKPEEKFVWEEVNVFIEEINKELKTRPKENFNGSIDDLSDMAVDNNTLVADTSDTELVQPQQQATTAFDFIGNCLKQIDQLRQCIKAELEGVLIQNQSSEYQIPDISSFTPRVHGELILQYVLFIAQAMDPIVPPLSPTTISTSEINHQENETNHVTERVETVTIDPTEYINNTPVVLIQPKEMWHYRSMKDLGGGHMPLLNGDGPQQTRIQVTVPAQNGHRMYLGVKAQTLDGKDHPYKLLVPEKTKVSTDSFVRDNDLNRLQFDKCEPTDHFDREKRFVYLEITKQEHLEKVKNVPVYMFNLYQRGSITRELIENKQLKQCKLAFWLFTLENNVHTEISPITQSRPIQQRRIN